MEAVLEKSTYEIERGKPMPSKNHGIVQSNLNFQLQLSYRKQYRIISEASMLIDGREKIPDLAIYPPLTYEADNDVIKIPDAPLCAIEILSPTQPLTELIVKSKDYFNSGVKSYWLVLPALKTVYVFSASNEYEAFVKNGILKDDLLDIELDVAQIFE